MKSLSLALTIALLSTASAGAATLQVPSHYGSIQAAINAALPHDVVEVSGGTYYEDLLISNKSHLTLRAAAGETVVVDAGGFGYPLSITGGVISGITVKKMTFRNTADAHGVWIYGADSVKIEKCFMNDVAWDGICVSYSSQVTVKKCEVNSPGRHGIAAFVSSLHASKNKINFPSENGIHLVGSQNSAVGNKIMSPGDNGIRLGDGFVFCANNLIQGNTVTLAAKDGIYCSDRVTSTTITENVLGKCQDDGINLWYGADWSIVSRNRIARAGDSGIETYSDHNSFSDNQIKKTVYDGIWVGSASNSGTYDRNRVAKSVRDGFDVLGTANTFRYNKASRSGDFDLHDQAGPFANSWISNSFGSTSP